jgi:hypothetical protein
MSKLPHFDFAVSQVILRWECHTDARSMDVSQGNPVPPASGGRARTSWIVVTAIFASGLIVGLILAGLHVAGAATPSPSASAHGKHFKDFGHGFGHHGFGGGIHGQYVVPKPGGGYQTVLTQIGTVESVSGSSITVKSEDGYSHTYDVNNDTMVAAGKNGIADVAKGDSVRVLAVGNAAKELIDVTKVQTLRQKYWKQKPEQPEGSESPEPSGSASATSTTF